jgi:hypothetical protein
MCALADLNSLVLGRPGPSLLAHVSLEAGMTCSFVLHSHVDSFNHFGVGSKIPLVFFVSDMAWSHGVSQFTEFQWHTHFD